MNDSSTKQEFTLEVSGFKEAKVSSGLSGLAKNIETLIIMDKGSYPDLMDMGVGIEDYEFEFLTPETISSIRYEVKEQIRKYIPNNNVQEVVVEALDNDDKLKRSIGIMITLSKSIDNKSEIIMVVNTDTQNNSIESTIFI